QRVQEETAFVTGEQGTEKPAADSATAIFNSAVSPSETEVTGHFQADSDRTTAGDASASGTLDASSSTGTIDEKTGRPKSRARLGLKEISGYEIISELGR